MKNRWGAGALALVCLLVGGLSFGAGHASAHFVASPFQTYEIVNVSAPWYYRCAVGRADLGHPGGETWAGAITQSKGQAFCSTSYSVAAGNIGAVNHLVWYDQGNPEPCRNFGAWNSATDWQVTVQGVWPSGVPPTNCLAGADYVNITSHTLYINGVARKAWLASPSHFFT